ncbi:MAG: DUF29 domain-containing protein [Alphaproteobacteria bacterium]
MTDPELYEADFYAWTKVQADRLRRLQAERANLDLDLPHLAEEVEDLGKSERNALHSQLRRIIEHCLKLEWSPATDPRNVWMASVVDARAEAEQLVSPTLLHDASAYLPKLYEQARRMAVLGLASHDEDNAILRLPSECPYTLDRLLADDWYPTNRHGVPD